MRPIPRLMEWWRSISPLLRVTTAVLWGSGVALFVVGLVGDGYLWWENRPFLTNLVSSITGACFGIPLALVVLQTLSAAQADTLEMRNTARLVVRTIEGMLQTSRQMLLRVDWVQQGNIRGALFELGRLANLDNDRVATFSLADVETLESAMERLSSTALRHLPPKQDLSIPAYELQSTWVYFKDAVRSRIAELDMPWLSPDAVMSVDSLLGSITSDGFNWLDILRGEYPINRDLSYAKENYRKTGAIDLLNVETYFQRIERSCMAVEHHHRASEELMAKLAAIDAIMRVELSAHLPMHLRQEPPYKDRAGVPLWAADRFGVKE